MTEYQRIWHSSGLRYLLGQAPAQDVSAVEVPHAAGHATGRDAFISSLPEQLLFYWQRTRLPLKIVWTYWELDTDFRGISNPERLSLWRSIMDAKHWNEKQVCFWPIAFKFNNAHALEPHMDAFASLVSFFSPVYVFCFGKKCHAMLRDFFSQADGILTGQSRFLFFPDALEMLPDNQEAKMQTWRQIKHLTV